MIKLILLTPLALIVLMPGQEIIVENTSQDIRYVIAEVTGYTSSEAETDSTPNLTAWQTPTRDGVIACPRSIEFGTIVEIDGKRYVCEDRMNLKYPDRWDIWFAEYDSAIEF